MTKQFMKDVMETPQKPPKLTRHQAAVIGAYTGVLCGPERDMLHYISQIMGRDIHPIELTVKEIAWQVMQKAKEDFFALAARDTDKENGDGN